MVAFFGDAVFCQHQNSVGISNGGKAVGNGKGCPALGQSGQRLCNYLFSFIV